MTPAKIIAAAIIMKITLLVEVLLSLSFSECKTINLSAVSTNSF
jgi:hypothetical protein